MVSRVVNVSPTAWMRWPAAASARLSLPSHSGWRAGSAIHSKMVTWSASITRDAETILGCSSLIPPAKHAVSAGLEFVSMY